MIILPDDCIPLYVKSNLKRQMKILIIGSEGFIGKHCAEFFQRQGHSIVKADVVEQTTPNYVCLNKTNTSFDLLFQSHTFDVCINASGSAHVGFSFEKPEVDFELNVSNVHKILVAIRSFCPTCKLINFSSAAVYGNPEKLPVNEEQQKNPVSPYGFHKLQSESLLKEYHRFFGLATCSLRVFSAYGPGLRKQLFWDVYQKTKSSELLSLFGSGNETRDFIFIDDLLVAIKILIESAPFEGEAYNIASGIETSIQEAVNVFCHQLNPKVSIQFTGTPKIGDPDFWVADITKLKALGFKAKYSIQDGLAQTVNWLTNLPE